MLPGTDRTRTTARMTHTTGGHTRAWNFLTDYLADALQSARTGTISIFDERYLMLRAPSLSVDFFTAIAETFAAGGT